MIKTSTLAVILAVMVLSVIVFADDANGAGLVKRAISTAGRWQPADLPTPTVLSNTTNTYTAGQKQIFQSSGTTAAIKIVTTTDPSGVVQGDIWFNTNDLKWQGSSVTQTAERTANKGIASGYTPLNLISLIPSRFLGSGTNSSSNFLRGDNTWSTALVTSNIGTVNNVTVSGATGAVTINLGSNVVTTGGQVQNVTKNLTLFGANTVKTSNTGLIVRNPLGTFATTIAGGAVTANRTLTLPITTGTLSTLDGTETLSSKTVTSPIINGYKLNFTKVTTGTAETATTTTNFMAINLNNGNYTLRLPTAVGITGQTLNIMVNSTAPNRNYLMISASGSEKIDGDANMNLTKNWDDVTLRSDGTGWTGVSNSKSATNTGSFMYRNPAFSVTTRATDHWVSSMASTAAAGAALAGKSATIEAYPIAITRTTTFDRLGFDIVAASAGATCRVGIYNSNEKASPFKLVANSVPADISTTLAIRVNGTIAVTLKPDLYFLAFQCSGTAMTVRSIATTNIVPLLGYNTVPAPAPYTGYSATNTYGAAFPNTFPQTVTSIITTPATIWLRPIG